MSNQLPSKFVSLVPTNGTQFTVEQGNKVIFELAPSLALVKGRDSYLVLDILNNSSDQKRTALNNMAGADSIIDRVDVYSLNTGIHLETMQNYNQWQAVTNQYYFEDKTNLQTLQGCGDKVYAFERSGGNNSLVSQPANRVANCQISPVVEATGSPVYNYRRFTTPLKAGIFRYWDEERLTPVIALQGLRIEITLADAKQACVFLDAVEDDGSVKNISPSAARGSGIPFPDGQSGANIICTNDMKVKNTGMAVGNLVKVYYNDGGDQELDTSITALADNGGKVQFTLADAVPGGTTAKSMILRSDTRALQVKPEFRVLSVAPPQGMVNEIGNGMAYEFTSYDYHVDNIPANARKHLIEFNSVATRANCIFTQFQPISGDKGELNSTYFSGDIPGNLNLNEVQYFINGRLQPVRSYDPGEKREKIIALSELNKALGTINKETQDLGNPDTQNLDVYTNTFMIGRQLARQPYYYNLRDAEGQIRLGFSGTRAGDTLANTFIWSKRIISIGQDASLNVLL